MGKNVLCLVVVDLSWFEITKGGRARVFEGGDGLGFTQLIGYHFSKVLTTIIAENKFESIWW